MVVYKSATQLEMRKFSVDEGIIEAYVTTFGNEDVVGDIMGAKSFDGFVKNFSDTENASLPMLWEHDRQSIIGEWTNFEIDEKGVIGTGTLYKGVSKADDVRVYLQKGAVGSVSIGFMSKDYDELESGGRKFNEVNLIETSIVITPANPMARIVSAKTDDGEIDIRLLEKALRDAGLSRTEAKTFISAGKDTLRDVVDTEKADKDVFINLINLYKES